MANRANRVIDHQRAQPLRREYDDVLNPDGASRTVAQAVDRFLDDQPRVGRSEQTIYLDHCRGSIIKAGLGQRTLGQLGVQEVDEFLHEVGVGTFGARPINRDGVRRTRRLLIRALNNEMRIGNLGRNVADLSVMPVFESGSPRKTLDNEDGDEVDDGRRSLTLEEFQRYRACARQPFLTFVELVGRNGLRPSEARALRWQCVDLEAMTLTVNRQMSSRDTLTAPKTKRARRTVPIDDQTAECLEAWAQRQEVRRVDGSTPPIPGLVLTTRHGTPVNRNNLRRTAAAVATRAGIEPIVPYELRHRNHAPDRSRPRHLAGRRLGRHLRADDRRGLPTPPVARSGTRTRRPDALGVPLRVPGVTDGPTHPPPHPC